MKHLLPVDLPEAKYNVYEAFRQSSSGVDALMSRDELSALTGTKQPKRMRAWLDARGWVYEPQARRGDVPKVLRAYRDARLTGTAPARQKRADYSFMTARLA